MTKEQLEHYLKGGWFRAKYNPPSLDLDIEALQKIGQIILVHQNVIINPLQTTKYKGQHAFNSPSIYGWIPEEDIELQDKIEEYISYPEPLPQYLYKMTYTRKDQIQPNFGKDFYPDLPFVVSREYSYDMDDYVVNKLSSPKATLVEKAIWKGEFEEVLEWKTIYSEQN